MARSALVCVLSILVALPVTVGAQQAPGSTVAPDGGAQGTDAAVAREAPRCEATVDPAAVERERQDVTVLAADGMDGRAPGTPGGEAAARYLVAALTSAGVAPAGTDGYLQPFVLEAAGRRISTANVVAIVHGTGRAPDGGTGTGTGRDAGRAVLVVGAHYDHLGHGGATSRAPGSTAVHHGADDNASGSAAVLDLARRLVRHPAAMDVVFVWFSGEELGLHGSRYFVSHRPPAARDIAAMMNFDMVGRLRHCRLYLEGTDTGRGLDTVATAANTVYGFDNRPWDGRAPWGASDHFSFRDARIPVVFFFTGLHDDYHTPADEAARVDYPGLAAVTAYGEAILRGIASAPAPTFVHR